MNNPKPNDAREPISHPTSDWKMGERVMARVSLPQGSSHLYTDLLGTIVELDAESITLHTRQGMRTIARSEIAIGKRIPPPPARRPPIIS